MRYHKDIGFPENYIQTIINFFLGFDDTRLTFHSISEMADDKLTIIGMPHKTNLIDLDTELIEIYTDGDEFSKVLLRNKSMSNDYDFLYVIANDGAVVSAWANEKDDDHNTLGKDIYFSKTSQKFREYPECLAL